MDITHDEAAADRSNAPVPADGRVGHVVELEIEHNLTDGSSLRYYPGAVQLGIDLHVTAWSAARSKSRELSAKTKVGRISTPESSWGVHLSISLPDRVRWVVGPPLPIRGCHREQLFAPRVRLPLGALWRARERSLLIR